MSSSDINLYNVTKPETYSWFLLLYPLSHLFFTKEPPWISRTTAKKASCIGGGSSELFLLFAYVEVLSNASQKMRFHPSLVFQPLDLFLV